MEQLFISNLHEYGLMALIVSFVIGILTALAPCNIVTLPLLVGSAVTLSSDMSKKEKKDLYIDTLYCLQ